MALSTSRGQKRGVIATHSEAFLAAIVGACMLGAALALFAIESHRPMAAASDARPLRVWFLDVGQGDATFIETPDGRQVLIDGGPDDEVLAKLGQTMPPWDRSIDLVIATHPDADHVGGLAEVLARYDVTEIGVNGEEKFTSAATAFDEAVQEESAQTTIVRAGHVWSFGEVMIEALWPRSDANLAHEDVNFSSIVLLLTYGDTRLLLTGDATDESEELYAQSAQDVDLLKAGHHGSNTSTTEFLLDAIAPEFAIVSCGEENRYGHPHPTVLSRLQEHGTAVFRTDLDGDILLTSFGVEPVVAPAPLPF